MSASRKQQLEQQVISAARDYGAATARFRNSVSSHLGVNITDIECLALLFFKGTSTPTSLGQHTGLSSGATTAMLDRLEHAQLIIRQPNPNDHRSCLVTTTPNALQIVGPFFTAVRDAQARLLAHYSEDDLALVGDFLRNLTEVWESGRHALPPFEA